METLVIVASDQPALFQYLKWGLAGTRSIRVILDRRLGSRRARPPATSTESASAERRHTDRRSQPAMAAELRARGFLIVRHDLGRAPENGQVRASRVTLAKAL
jgi:hypothetical protein